MRRALQNVISLLYFIYVFVFLFVLVFYLFICISEFLKSDSVCIFSVLILFCVQGWKLAASNGSIRAGSVLSISPFHQKTE